jgi:xylulokinase
VTSQRNIIIAADFGTSGVKVGLMGRDLRVQAEVFRDYPVSYLANDAVEQNPEDWWKGFRAALKELRRKWPDEMKRAAALVFSAQMCGVTPVSADGTALRNTLIWMDKRSASLIRSKMGGFPTVAGYGARRLATSIWLTNGAPSLNGMDPPGKMMWLRQNEPEVWNRTYKFLDVKDWLIYRATGVYATTADCANLTWMMNSRGGKPSWSPYLMRLFGLRIDQLPEIVAGTSSPGGLTAAAARDLGLDEGLPVVAGSGDVGAAALGSGAIEDGALHLCLGTSSWIGGFYPGRRLSARESYATITSSIDNRPLLIATQESAGACIEWLDGVASNTQDPQRRADDVSPPLFLPWMAGERVPVDDNTLRGAFLGLTFRHGSSSLSDAVLEGISLNTRWAYQSVARQRGTMKNQRMPVVGGAAINANLCQSLADCLNIELIVGPTPRMAGMQGTGAIASAFLGWHANAWAAASCLSRPAATIYSPVAARHHYFNKRFQLFLKAFQQMKPWMKQAHAEADLP